MDGLLLNVSSNFSFHDWQTVTNWQENMTACDNVYFLILSTLEDICTKISEKYKGKVKKNTRNVFNMAEEEQIYSGRIEKINWKFKLREEQKMEKNLCSTHIPPFFHFFYATRENFQHKMLSQIAKKMHWIGWTWRDTFPKVFMNWIQCNFVFFLTLILYFLFRGNSNSKRLREIFTYNKFF